MLMPSIILIKGGLVSANGYARGEGFGMMVLKRVSDALRDGDTIRAVIRGSASNQDGKSPGITQPTRQGQEALIRSAYSRAGLDLDDTRFFEAHGTGTPIGDPLEAGAISDCFTASRSSEDPIYIGALKGNLGHLEGAAGIAGLIKAVHVLESGLIPPNLNFERLNPKIPADEWNLAFPTELTSWKHPGLRRASVNSFGFGGSNAHVIVDDAYHYLTSRNLEGTHATVISPSLEANMNGKGAVNGGPDANGVSRTNGDTQSSAVNGNGAVNGHNWAPDSEGLRIFTLSAHDSDGIHRLAKSYSDMISRHLPSIDKNNQPLCNFSYTLWSKRTHFPWRAYTIAKDFASLENTLASGSLVPVRVGVGGNLAFVFTGQGAQWAGMARELMVFQVFEKSIQDAERYLNKLGCSWTLTEIMFTEKQAKSIINNAAYSQPICTILQVALVELLRSWATYPSAVVGHSSGEIAAAYSVGAISRESAWRIAYYRGLLSAKLPHMAKEDEGEVGMLAVGLDQKTALSHMSDLKNLVVACFNSPKSVTISGNVKEIEILQRRLSKEVIFNRRLNVDNAYHSRFMQPIAEEYRHLIAEIDGDSNYINGSTHSDAPKFYSSLAGGRLPIRELQTPDYWVENLVSPVKFSDAVSHILTDKSTVTTKLGDQQPPNPVTEFLELGPHSALQGPLREIMGAIPNTKDIGYTTLLRRREDAIGTIMEAAGWLYTRGQHIDIEAVNNSRGIHDSKHESPKMVVDLPPYPFNHSTTYWRESRLSKGYRLREYPRHELLGAPVPDWNKMNAIWRNWIRLNENPWVKDHMITGSIIYPAAGMLVMAIEAMRQLSNPQKVLKGLRMREVVFMAALRVPTSVDGVETHFYVRPYLDSISSTSSNWSEFQLSSHDGEEWRDHCRGLIQAEYQDLVTAVDDGLEQHEFLRHCTESVSSGETSCIRQVPTIQLYELLHTAGFDFGETFQNLSDIAIDSSQGAVATITAPDLRNRVPSGHVQPHLIHPTTLDGVFQTTIVALTKGGQDLGNAVVPTSIKELWIAANGMDTPLAHNSIRVSSKAQALGMRQIQATATGVDPITREPIITIEDFVATSISSGQQNQQDPFDRHLCFNQEWKPDIDFINQKTAVKLFRPGEELTGFDPTEVIAKVEMLCYLYIRRYMKSHDESKIDNSKPWYQKYISWMKHQFECYARGELVHSKELDWDSLAEDDEFFADLESEMEVSTPEAIMTVTVGRNLREMLQGTLDPLEVFFNTPILENVYARGTGSQLGYSYIVNYIDNMAHKNSGISILEVGAGTGGATVPILDVLTRHGDGEGAPRFEKYDFTDISPSFFEQAKVKFHKTANRMGFKTFNAEKDAIQQGFEPKSYDIIIAANVIHATKNIEHTLENCRKLLKPGGKLILNELTNSAVLRTGFGFGLLPGWWLSEEPHRQWGPLMPASDWEKHLKRVGFSGVDIYFQDYYDEANHLNGVLVATALETETTAARALRPTVVIFDARSKLQTEVAEELERMLVNVVPQLRTVSLDDHMSATDFGQKQCIFLPELDSSYLSHVDEGHLQLLKDMTANLDSLIWLTQGGGPGSQNPDGEMVNGLARVVRQENPVINFVTLAIAEVTSARAVAETTRNIINSINSRKARPASTPDNSFWESPDGVLHVCRLVEDFQMNKAIVAKTTQQAASAGKFGGEDGSRALRLAIGSPGLLDTLQFVDDPRHDTPLAEGEVEFKIVAAGLNFLDIMVALGQVVGNNLGCEGAGIITRTGPNCNLRIGDRVCGIGYWLGAFGTYSRSSELSLARIPDNMSFKTAAGFAVVFVTAYVALYEMANIQPGESVLVHAAAGGVGQACIQLAKVRGAEIYATVGSIEKRDLLIEKYGIPKDHILSSRDLTFAKGIKRLTKGRGVDVAVNSLSGDALRATWDSMAPFGRFVEVGKVDIYSSARLNMATFRNNVSFAFVDISFMCEHKPERFGVVMDDLMRLVREGKIGALSPTISYPFSAIQEAFRYMQSGIHSGKIVLEPHEDDIVPIVPSRKDTYDLDQNASYVISGGLGGLGRSISRWMASRGAKNLILLSRSGNTTSSSRELVSDLESLGVRVATPPCNVSDLAALEAALAECQANGMPPVKGCIQGSMVLKDSLFVNMSLEDYYAAVRPKVQASWNLHNTLPKELDFFILLSSISTIWGNRGQSNYNMGNCFQDALARYRVLNGLKAHVLDVGMVLSVGYVAENKEDLVNLMRHIGAEGTRQEELHAILNELCDPSLPVPSLLKTQVSLGLQLPEARALQGLEPCGWMADPLVRHLHQIRTGYGETGAGEGGNSAANYGLMLTAAESFEAACEVVYDAIAQKLVNALNISAGDVDPNKPLHGMGVDSLVAVELRTWILKHLDADIAVFDLMETSSMRALAALVASRSSLAVKQGDEGN
ncbi:putative PKS/NRPS-like protein biosynthetic cluster [Cytospora paraplurivora]|uniref:PKS/NRPS-like protein biosynthetic cluster n=1 Tax=Cytospora paraplurivora TaxID=2898453 RepID=A0AAN9YBU8_9PEZI